MTFDEFVFFLQELIEVDSDVVFELASYILQVRSDFDHKPNSHNFLLIHFFPSFVNRRQKVTSPGKCTLKLHIQ